MNSRVDHYENFPVASVLLPAHLREAVVRVYRFARETDDIADEGQAPPDERLAALAAYGTALDALERGETPAIPTVAALAGPVQRHRLPIPALRALLSAFSQDVVVGRYRDRAALLDYCRRSADPVGRLMLALAEVSGPQALRESDAICSGLQLLNFAQDVANDWARNRVYIPQDELAAAGLCDADIAAACTAGRSGPALAALVRDQAARAAAMIESGRPLVKRLPGRFSLEIRLVIASSLTLAQRLARPDTDVFARRHKLRRRDAPAILLRALRDLLRPAQRPRDVGHVA